MTYTPGKHFRQEIRKPQAKEQTFESVLQKLINTPCEGHLVARFAVYQNSCYSLIHALVIRHNKIKKPVKKRKQARVFVVLTAIPLKKNSNDSLIIFFED